ncbi:hypothetical protein FRC17_005041, partial [Serendipita sp. 399]
MTGGDTLTDEVVKQAWRVDIDILRRDGSGVQAQLSDLAGSDVQWRVLSMDERVSPHLTLLRLSQLRRLEIDRDRLEFDIVLEDLTEILKCFKGALETLTWLEYCTSDWMRDMDDGEKPITLPNLQ